MYDFICTYLCGLKLNFRSGLIKCFSFRTDLLQATLHCMHQRTLQHGKPVKAIKIRKANESRPLVHLTCTLLRTSGPFSNRAQSLEDCGFGCTKKIRFCPDQVHISIPVERYRNER